MKWVYDKKYHEWNICWKGLLSNIEKYEVIMDPSSNTWPIADFEPKNAPIYPFLNIIRVFLKNIFRHFQPFSNTCHQPDSSHFGHNMNLPSKLKAVSLNNFFNKSHQVQFQKNPVNKYLEKFKNVDFGLKNAPIYPFLSIIRVFQPFSNTCHQVHFQKNLMNRFRKKVKRCRFWA